MATKTEKAKFKKGDLVKITAKIHPWAGSTGEVVRFEKVSLTQQMRPVVRLHDTCDHECFLMRDEDAKVLK